MLTQLKQELTQRPLPEQEPKPQEETPQRHCPELAIDKRGWFMHWDEDCSGVLEREEVVRGMAQAFKSDVPSRLCRKRLRMRCIVESMWPLVDLDGNDRITLDEFSKEGGLADLIIEKFIIDKPQPPVQSPRLKAGKSPWGKSDRPRAVRGPSGSKGQPIPDEKWQCSTDLSDDGLWDAPWIIRRPSLGFFSKDCRRRADMQWAGAEADLGKWHRMKYSSQPGDQEDGELAMRGFQTEPVRSKRITNLSPRRLSKDRSKSETVGRRSRASPTSPRATLRAAPAAARGASRPVARRGGLPSTGRSRRRGTSTRTRAEERPEQGADGIDPFITV